MHKRKAPFEDLFSGDGSGSMTGHCLPAFWKGGGATGAQVPLHNTIISNFMIYQYRLETNLLQLFAHT